MRESRRSQGQRRSEDIEKGSGKIEEEIERMQEWTELIADSDEFISFELAARTECFWKFVLGKVDDMWQKRFENDIRLGSHFMIGPHNI